MGGGNLLNRASSTLWQGLSPRGRGKLPPWAEPAAGKWSIPAWAGETTARSKSPEENGVYPRVGGGNSSNAVGSGKGTGLSPRGRGKPTPRAMQVSLVRSIPAWAGETPPYPRHRRHPRVYPRVGGGNPGTDIRLFHRRGLSPRGRGKPFPPPRVPAASRSIPAWAGETRLVSLCLELGEVYPRVGGGNGVMDEKGQAGDGLSPRGRGKLWPGRNGIL